MKPIRLSPSLMCADLMNLTPTLRVLEEAGADMLHIDVMDGEYVPNYAFGTDFIRRLQGETALPLDIHLMVNRPEAKVGFIPLRPGDLLSVHAEAAIHLQRCLAAIRDRGALSGVALNPATPLSAIEEVLDDLDFILLMTVNPGFAGQQMVPATLGKITRLRRMLDARGLSDLSIEVDGNVSFLNGARMAAAGADILVGGSSSVFSKENAIPENIRKIRSLLAQG